MSQLWHPQCLCLKKALTLINETTVDVRAQLAEQGVELIEAPVAGVFSNPSADIYRLMYAAHQGYLAATPIRVVEENERDNLTP